jgi:hypothetical protein
MKHVRQLLTEQNHVLPSHAQLVEMNVAPLQTTVPQFHQEVRFALCALKVYVEIANNVIPKQAHQHSEFAKQLVLAIPILTLAAWFKHAKQLEEMKHAQILLAPVQLNALILQTIVLHLLMALNKFVVTALSHKMNATQVMSARHRLVSLMKVTALLEPPTAVLLKKLQNNAL